MLGLSVFTIYSDNPNCIPVKVRPLLKAQNIVPRYTYASADGQWLLVQAGSSNGIDSLLISMANLTIYTIEFKEPGAKTSEPDLPKYEEDGYLKVTQEFLDKNPQFKAMLSEHKKLNFFESMGHNIHEFSAESVNIAVSNNYTNKQADVVCTEDIDGFFVMMPTQQISTWAHIEGEIRPAGRNHSRVWTPQALRKFLIAKNATFAGNSVFVPEDMLEQRRERGGNGRVSGYKITPLFFVYVQCCEKRGNIICFDINDVEQLRPTIAGKVFFIDLTYTKVADFYKPFL